MKVTYSVNLITWLVSKGVTVEYGIDDAGMVFGAYETNDDVESVKASYRSNEELQLFLDTFRDVKRTMCRFKQFK